jgi:hypothetical protein
MHTVLDDLSPQIPSKQGITSPHTMEESGDAGADAGSAGQQSGQQNGDANTGIDSNSCTEIDLLQQLLLRAPPNADAAGELWEEVGLLLLENAHLQLENELLQSGTHILNVRLRLDIELFWSLLLDNEHLRAAATGDDDDVFYLFLQKQKSGYGPGCG